MNLFAQLAPQLMPQQEVDPSTPVMLQGVPLPVQKQIKNAAELDKPPVNQQTNFALKQSLKLPEPQNIDRPQYEKAMDDALMKMMMQRQSNVDDMKSQLQRTQLEKPTAFEALNLKPLQQWADMLNGTHFSYSTQENNKMDKYNSQVEKLKDSIAKAEDGISNDQLNYLKIRMQEEAANKRFDASLKSAERQAARANGGEEDKLRSQYINNPIYKNMAEINQAYQGIANNPGTSGAAQQAMVYQFSKILDPGSVVKEGEYAMSAANAGKINQARQYLTMLNSGQMLTPPQVALMKDVARNLVESSRGIMDEHNNLYRQLAINKGVNPANVVIDPFYKKANSPKQAVPPAPLKQAVPSEQVNRFENMTNEELEKYLGK